MLRLPGTGSIRHRPKSSVCLVERTDGSVVAVEVLAATCARHRERAAPPRSGITEQTTVEDFGRTLLVTSPGGALRGRDVGQHHHPRVAVQEPEPQRIACGRPGAGTGGRRSRRHGSTGFSIAPPEVAADLRCASLLRIIFDEGWLDVRTAALMLQLNRAETQGAINGPAAARIGWHRVV